MSKNISIDLNSGTATVRLFGEIGLSTRQIYEGSFVFRTVLDSDRIFEKGRIFRELLGPYADQAPDHEYNLALAHSELHARVLSAPPWWTHAPNSKLAGGGVRDENIVLRLFDLAAQAQEEYIKELRGETKKVFDALKEKVEKFDQIEKETESPEVESVEKPKTKRKTKKE